jgi:radical SAM family uncharacterized protein/radical SAM-linked protein
MASINPTQTSPSSEHLGTDTTPDKTLDIKAAIEPILASVQNPGMYIGGEPNQVVKDPKDVSADMVLAFPDSYQLGMSHNGTRVLYHLINKESDLYAERCFCPLPDMGDLLKENNIPLYSLETFRPLSSFTSIGISLQTELNYTNVPYMLELGGVHAFQKDRGELEPFVVGGGPCMANPEPVADFFDLFVIGDGELLAPQILKVMGNGRQLGKTRKEILVDLSEIPGVYVPSLVDTILNDRGEHVANVETYAGAYERAKGVKRVWIDVLNKDDYPVANPIPNTGVVHERFSVEVMRGCTQGCRFCQAGYWYRPNRELEPDAVIDLAKQGMKATGERELGLLSLSTADYGQVESVTDYFVEQEEFKDVNLSLPSLRANSFGQELAAKVNVLGGGKSATFAPETGSERLRKLINKTISDKDMYEAAEGVFQNGFSNIKLYTMVGLPTENLDDMEAFCGLIEGLVNIARKHGGHKTVHPSIGILVPKPFTPIQWCGFMPREKVMEHINYVRNRFRYNKNVRITWTDWETACVEAFFSRGDRSISSLIYKQYQKGKIFETFMEHFDYASWEETWKEANYPIDRVYQDIDLEASLPWDFIHAGVSKLYLKSEYKKMFVEDPKPIPDCKWGDCQRCGIPGNYQDTQLAEDPKQHTSKSKSLEELKALHKERKSESPNFFSYLLTYEKTGLSKFLPHQALIKHLEKAFRRLEVPLKYSKGFHPRPVIKNAGALPLGLESRCEILVMDFLIQLQKPKKLAEELSAILPEGIRILSLEPSRKGKFPRVETVSYKLFNHPASLYKHTSLGELGTVTSFKGREYDLNQEILNIWQEDEDVCFTVRTNESGGGISPYLVYSYLLGCDEKAVRSLKVQKTDVVFAETVKI